MNIFKLPTLVSAAIVTALLGSQPRLAPAGGADFSKSVMEDTSTGVDLGTGKFAASPFHVSVSVRGGYDDNVNLTAFDEQASAFINVAGELIYQFGSPRTQLRLDAVGGFTYYFNRESDVLGNNDNNYDVNASVAFAIV